MIAVVVAYLVLAGRGLWRGHQPSLSQKLQDDAVELLECREHLNEAQETVYDCEHALTACTEGARYTEWQSVSPIIMLEPIESVGK